MAYELSAHMTSVPQVTCREYPVCGSIVSTEGGIQLVPQWWSETAMMLDRQFVGSIA
jgi:hypothetical protein